MLAKILSAYIWRPESGGLTTCQAGRAEKQSHSVMLLVPLVPETNVPDHPREEARLGHAQEKTHDEETWVALCDAHQRRDHSPDQCQCW